LLARIERQRGKASAGPSDNYGDGAGRGVQSQRDRDADRRLIGNTISVEWVATSRIGHPVTNSSRTHPPVGRLLSSWWRGRAVAVPIAIKIAYDAWAAQSWILDCHASIYSRVPARLAFVRPLSPSASVRPPRGDDWQHEPKWDGFRFQSARVRFYSRSGADYTDRLPRMVEAFGKLPTQSAMPMVS